MSRVQPFDPAWTSTYLDAYGSGFSGVSVAKGAYVYAAVMRYLDLVGSLCQRTHVFESTVTFRLQAEVAYCEYAGRLSSLWNSSSRRGPMIVLDSFLISPSHIPLCILEAESIRQSKEFPASTTSLHKVF